MTGLTAGATPPETAVAELQNFVGGEWRAPRRGADRRRRSRDRRGARPRAAVRRRRCRRRGQRGPRRLSRLARDARRVARPRR